MDNSGKYVMVAGRPVSRDLLYPGKIERRMVDHPSLVSLSPEQLAVWKMTAGKFCGTTGGFVDQHQFNQYMRATAL